ncbi:uncharacterized protein LOC118416168 [Branchiostoma floridae]|uniref:Uncharacterized protein LOC118416168 n=1 Tax=Branchiostoma floridae TaxID=7739 RepID=C3YPR0_BRAFL|nr:uncharacterized protein LOC118416168 [Branchiostoma floridae]|eukprot:XP_002601832.1 hypothetical protein BRAFLDRAFT_75950 [Branchiostoma floridae]
MAFLSRSVLLVVVAMLLTLNLTDSKWFRFRTRRRSQESGGASSDSDRSDQDDGQLDMLEEMIEKQQKQINELETSRKLLQVRVDLQADKIKELEGDKGFLQSIKDEIVDLAKEVKELKMDKDDLRNTVGSQKAHIITLQRELAGLADCCSGGSGDVDSFLPLVEKVDKRRVVP